MLVLKNTKATIEVEFDAAVDLGHTVTVTITDADGNVVENAQAAAVDPDGPTGAYTFDLPPQPEVAELTCVWTGQFSGVVQSLETSVSVVGRGLFSIPELRSFKDKVLNDANSYPDELIDATHKEIVEFFQRECDVSFVPRYGQVTLNGNWRRAIWVPNRKLTKLLRVVVDGTALSPDLVAQMAIYLSGKVDRTALWGSYWQGWKDDNVVISYVHGWPAPPERIRTAAKLLARYELVKTDPTDRMVAMTNDLGTVRLSIPSFQYPTGIPIVDATLAKYDEHSPIEVY